jgi:hypothetical protein
VTSAAYRRMSGNARGVTGQVLSPQRWARLELELRKGPLAHGSAGDQRWTPGRIKTLIGKPFHVGYIPKSRLDEL